MRFLFLLLAFISTPFLGFSQGPLCSDISAVIDSLELPDSEAKALVAVQRGEKYLEHNTCADSLNFKLRLALVNAYYNFGKFPQVIALTEGLDERKFEKRNKFYLLEMLSRRANVLSYQLLHADAIALADRTLLLSAELDSVKYYKLLTNKGLMLAKAGMFKESLALYHKSLTHFQNIHDEKSMAIMYNNIAEVYRERFADYPRALKMYKSAVRINVAHDDLFHLAKNYNNIGICFSKQEQADSALSYFDKALAINQKLGNNMGVIKTQYNIGVLYEARKRYKKAQQYYQDNLKISKQIGFEPGLYFSYMGLASVETQLGNFEKSLELMALGENLFGEGNSMEMKEIYASTKVANLKGLKRFEEALMLVESFDQEEDSINAFKNEQTTLMLRAAYEAELDRLEKKQLVDAYTATKEILYKEKRWNAVYLGFGLVVVILLAIATVFYLQKKKAYNKQKALVNTINQQNESLAKTQEELSVQLEMKTKILSVLGHDLRAPFASISGLLNTLSSEILSLEDAKPIVKQLSLEVEQTLSTLGNILAWSRLQLSVTGIQRERFALDIMMKAVIAAVLPAANAKGISIKLACDQGVEILADPNQLRSILNNLLNNAIKFSETNSEVLVRYAQEQQMHVITVVDNGIGLSAEALQSLNRQQNYTSQGTAGEKGTGIGLSLVRDFVVLHGGELVYYNNQPKGTVVEIRLPITV